MRPVRVVAHSVVAALLLACQSGPRDVVAGTDACDFCRMTIADTRFAGELASRAGRLHVFDSIECLASFYLDAQARDDVRAVWVADFRTSALLPVDSVVFLRDSRIASPMGRSLIAFAATAAERALVAEYGGTPLRWPALLDLVRNDHAPGR
jgi:copper chaperone NosL